MKTAVSILQEKWGHSTFRPLQEEIIKAVVTKKNTIVLLPTGGGKSICYQIPALINEGICLVISPLLALMQDQIESLQRKNIKAAALNTALTQNETITLFDNIQFNNYKFLYLSPEKLQSKFIQEKIKQLNISLIAIDEAHCISEWGHDFRPAYQQLQILKELCPKANTIALTASATEKVLQDISVNLDLDTPILFKQSFKREKLAYQIFEVDNKLFKIKQILTKINAPCIIYTDTRGETKKISDLLNHYGFTSTYYHGGLSNNEKKEAYENWYSEKKRIMVATNAFGMGIDKANIRVVIHVKLPSSIENYMQEAGRGGRDGKKAFSVTLFNQNDIDSFKNQTIRQNISIDFFKKIYTQLNQYFQISIGEHTEKNFDFDLKKFCNQYQFSTTNTYEVLKTLHRENILSFNESFQKKSYLKFTANHQYVLEYSNKFENRGTIIKALLRNYGGFFENFITIDEYYLSKKLNCSKSEFTNVLEQIHKDNIVNYMPSTHNASLQFLVPREDGKTINRISKKIISQQKNKQEKAKKLLEFIENSNSCRSKQLLAYFNENTSENCGICDVCIANKNTSKPPNTESIVLNLLKNNAPLSSNEITLQIPFEERIILRTLENLLTEGKIKVTDKNKYTTL